MYLLWLEETRLQESIYLPSLPAQYSPQKLESILNGDDVSIFIVRIKLVVRVLYE